MRLIVDHAILRTALSLCVSVIEKRATIPSLANVRMTADGDALLLATTDLEVTATYSVPCIVAKAGVCTVEANALLDIAKFAPEALNITLNEKNMTLAITSGTASWELPAMPLESYPSLPEMDDADELQFSPSELLTMLRTVSYAVSSHDEVGMSLRGAQLAVKKRSASICATNGRRLAVTTLPGLFKRDATIFLIAKLVRASEKLSATAEATNLTVEWSANHAVLRLGDVALYGRFPNVNGYPDTEEALRERSSATARFETERLIAAIRRIRPFARTATTEIVVALDSSGADISSPNRSGVASSRDLVPTLAFSGDRLRKRISSVYLLEALSAVHTETVDVDFGGTAEEFVTVEPVESSLPFSALHIIAPIYGGPRDDA